MKKRLILFAAVLPVLFCAMLLTDLSALAEEDPVPPRLSPFPLVVGKLRIAHNDLGGSWSFHRAPADRFWENEILVDAEGWCRIKVPGEWAMQGHTVEAGHAAGYRRLFDIPAQWKGKRIKLRCDAVYSDATVWINGREAGRHMGGFTPFELDITDLVEPGESNRIALAVRNESLVDTLASGTQYAAHQLGGITRKIRIFALPAFNVASLHVETVFDADYKDAILRVRLIIANEGTSLIEGAQIEIALAALPPIEAAAITPALFDLPAVPPGETIRHVVEFPVEAPRKWDCEHPNLYQLTCTLLEAGERAEVIPKRIGFRQVEVRGCELFVNGSPVKLRGVCRHETHPLLGRALSDWIWQNDVILFREANVNFIRTVHYPPAEEFLAACDTHGIFVEEEAPICWIGHGANPYWKEHDGDTPEVIEAVRRCTIEMIERDWSHPSVIIWSLANESAWGAAFKQSAEAARRADPTRPLSFHDQAWGGFNNHGSNLDVANMHYPGPGGPEHAASSERPLLFGEFCHLNTYNREEIVADPGVRENWGRAFSAMWEKIYRTKACLGGSIWSGMDDVFLLPDGRTTGYGEWGVVDSWRRRKPEFWHVKKAYSPVRILTKELPLPQPGESLTIDIENRHDFTNLSEIRSVWHLGSESGNIIADIPPRATGSVTITPSKPVAPGARLSLKFMSTRHFTIDTVMIPFAAESPAATSDAAARGTGAINACSEAGTGAFKVTGEGFVWRFDQATGSIRSAEIDGETVLAGGPELMLLPLKTGPCSPAHKEGIAPLNDICAGWITEDVHLESRKGCVEIEVRGRSDAVSGSYTLRVDGAGGLTIDYSFRVKEAINPRQWGLVFTLPGRCTTLAWERDSLWRTYPEGHIGRPRGETTALRGPKYPATTLGGVPGWPVSQDQNALGTVDFRSTRERIKWVTLTAGTGAGIRIDSDGTQGARAYLDEGKVRLLVTGFTTGGADMFFASHIADTRAPIAAGGTIADRIKLRLIKK
jgi:beta-galactosidase